MPDTNAFRTDVSSLLSRVVQKVEGIELVRT